MLNPLSSIRSDERRLVLGAVLTLWGIMVGHSIMETARDSLFLASLPATRLPFVYLGIALSALLLTQLQSRLRLGSDNRRILGFMLLSAAGVTALLWALSASRQSWTLFAIYIWAGVYATLIVTRFWMVVEDVFTVTQAKRLFALIGAGSVLGAITGTALARAMTVFVDPRQFLLAAMLGMAMTGLAPLLMLRRKDSSGLSEQRAVGQTSPLPCPNPLNWPRCMHAIMSRPYVSRLMLLTLLSTVVLTLVDYLFKSVVADRVAAEDLAGFFSTTYLCLNLLSLMIQLTLVGIILRSFGLNRVLGTMPAFLGAGAVVVIGFHLFGPALILIPVIGLKSIDGSLRYSLHRTSLETLFVPLTREMRNQVKTFIDVVGQRGGQAAASVLILLLVLLPATEVVLAVAILVFALVWIVVGSHLRQHYLDLFRDTLSEGRFETQLSFPELDLASLETLIAKLNSSNDLEVLSALDLLVEQGRAHLIPALALYHPSPRVVLRVLEIFAQHHRDDALPILERLEDAEDPRLRAAALRARAVLAPDVNRQLKRFLDDPSPAVRATALVTLVGVDWIKGEEAERTLSNIARGASQEEKLALLQSIQKQPHPIYVNLLLELDRESRPSARAKPGQHPDRSFRPEFGVALRLEIARAMREVRDARFLPGLLQMLAVRTLRAEARKALVSLGDDALNYLDAALDDRELPSEIRRHIPRTLHLFDPNAAAGVLIKHLMHDPDGLVRFKILRALGALRNLHPDIPLDEKSLRRAAEATLGGAFRLVHWRLQLIGGARVNPARATPVQALLIETLEHKESSATERIFRLLNLMLPQEDWQRIHQGLSSPRPEERSSSLELIENLLVGPFRDSLLGFLDRTSDRERLTYAGPYFTARPLRYEDVLLEFLEAGRIGLRSLTLYHIGELGLTEFRERMSALADEASPLLRAVVERSLGLLEHPETETIQYEQ